MSRVIKNRRNTRILTFAVAALLTVGMLPSWSAPPANAISVNPTAETTWTAHVQNVGNQRDYDHQALMQNSHLRIDLGTTGRSLRLESVAAGPVIFMTESGRKIVCTFSAQGHVQNIGWQGRGRIAGTSGRSLRLEAIRIWSDCAGLKFTYSVHVQNIGWMSSKTAGQTAGTVGRGLQIEALSITVTLPDIGRDARDADRRLCAMFGC